MSSTSNITISLQPTTSSKAQDPIKSIKDNGLDDDEHNGGFDKALKKVQRDQATKSGKELPRENAMREERPVAD
jgi:hypothetical protein